MVIPLGNQAAAKKQCIGAQLLSRTDGMSRIAGHQVERCGMAECHAVQLERLHGTGSMAGRPQRARTARATAGNSCSAIKGSSQSVPASQCRIRSSFARKNLHSSSSVGPCAFGLDQGGAGAVTETGSIH
jgi:hypothetical protein